MTIFYIINYYFFFSLKIYIVRDGKKLKKSRFFLNYAWRVLKNSWLRNFNQMKIFNKKVHKLRFFLMIS